MAVSSRFSASFPSATSISPFAHSPLCTLIPVHRAGRTADQISKLKISSRISFSRSYKTSSFRCFSALTPQLKDTLDKVISAHKVVVFMKGTKEFPLCGFSNTMVQILKSLNIPFEAINILENEALRQGLKEYSSWPTFPQLYIDGEFFGGCDITVEAFKNGELQEALERAICS